VIFAGLGFLWLAGGEDSDPETDLTTPRPVQVLTGETAQAKDIIPDPAAIARAQAFLGEEGVIGLLACNLSSEYHATHTREMSDFARAYGLRTKTFDADSDAYKQLTLLEQARNEGIQAMIVCALDNELMGPALESAQAGGIRMVFIHNDSASYGGVRLGGDDYMLGYVPGQYAGEVLQDRLGGRGGVIILDYPDLEAVVIRANGMEDGLLSRSPEAEILGRYLGGTQEFAYESVKGLLEEGIKFEVVLSINDAGAYGAIQALEEFDYQGDEVIIVSVDAEVQARQYMREGRFIWGSVAAGRTESAKAAIDAMVDLLAGEPIAENILTEPGELITRQTLAEQEN
jgi:ABC-type sugar transport system substrate-binding protein